MALDGPLDLETRDNLSMSHAASKVSSTEWFVNSLTNNTFQSLLFTINDLLVSL